MKTRNLNIKMTYREATNIGREIECYTKRSLLLIQNVKIR